MSLDLDQLLHQYENGHISRRQLLGALTVAVGTPRASAGQPEIGAADFSPSIRRFRPVGA